MNINIEIKETNPKIVEDVAEMISKYEMEEQIMISSFKYDILNLF